MKSATPEYREHLAASETTLTNCWRCERLDGAVFGFTEHDRDLVIDGLTYEAASGFMATAIRDVETLAVDNLDVQGAFSSDRITEADLLAGLWDYAEIRIFQVNWSDLSMGILRERKGRIGNVSSGKLVFSAELRGLMQNLSQQQGRLYGISCDADLGDSRCKFALETLRVTGSLTARNDNRVLFDSSRTEPDGWFNFGLLTWTSGNNVDLSMEVKRYVQINGLIELVLPMPYAVFASDSYSMTPGCDKAFSTCVNKFNNAVNNRSFPHIPGPSKLISGGSS